MSNTRLPTYFLRYGIDELPASAKLTRLLQNKEIFDYFFKCSIKHMCLSECDVDVKYLSLGHRYC